MNQNIKQSVRAATILAALLSLFALAPIARTADLVLADEGNSHYQIVTPEASGDALLDACLHETAKLIQAAFRASGPELPIVKEGDRHPSKPSIFLGNTGFARSHDVDVSKLEGWSYVHRVAGRNLIIAGRDHAPPNITVANLGSTSHFSYRLGTLKAATDFLRQFVQTRFLYPGAQAIPTQTSKTLRTWSFDAADIHFVKLGTIAIPEDLDVQQSVFTRTHTRKRTAVLYDVANNFFPKVDDAAIGHTWGKAVPAGEYRQSHPEYFALLSGQRTHEGQYCLSNAEFRELVYQFHKQLLDQGCASVNILQPDGFRPCQCEPCKKLYGVDDWGEKIWLFHREVAERLRKECPGKKLLATAYTVTKSPPTSFETFPDNVIIQTVDAINQPTELFKKWTERHKGEFGIWLHNWIANQTSRYTPMRTPLFVSQQVRFFHEYNTRSVFRDGLGDVFGLEGPTYYVFGRMFDDPENLEAKDLVIEFCDSAFGDAGPSMIRFYDRLHHGIELYSRYLGTHGVGWTYRDIYGRRHKHVRDPMQMLGFLYTPALIETLEKELAQAEQKGRGEKIKARLALVRREFNYLKQLAAVVHLYQAYRTAPSLPLREQLLDAVDTRNAEIAAYYQAKGPHAGNRPLPMAGWDTTLFPPGGHNVKHLRLGHNRYQGAFADTVFNWDTAAVRQSPLPGAESLSAILAVKPPTLDSAQWQDAPVAELKPTVTGTRLSHKTVFRVLYDSKHLYLRIEAELPTKGPVFKNRGEDSDLTEQESIDVYLGARPGREIFHRFTVGPDQGSRFDAASGLIDDVLNLLYDKDDSRWDGKWTYESRVERKRKRWLALLRIPFTTLGASAPEPGANWRINLSRTHVIEPERLERSIWSTVGATRDVGDRNALGELTFRPADYREDSRAANPLRQWREDYYRETFEIPAPWKALPRKLLVGPLNDWKFRIDPLEKGIKDRWHGVKVDEANWLTMQIPSFWAENEKVGKYEGVAWYRTKFNVPAAWKGKSIRLLFGSVDEQAWVYVNGHLVREHSEKSEGKPYGELWELPFTADISTERIEFGQSNLLVVRVNNAKANGGLWRPVFVQAVNQ